MGWITQNYGWPYVFYFMGSVGIVVSLVWLKVIFSPKDHPRISADELGYLERGGALVDMDRSKAGNAPAGEPKWGYVKQLLGNRMLLGVYVAQYCITTLTYFFLTWFPIYLVQERGF